MMTSSLKRPPAATAVRPSSTPLGTVFFILLLASLTSHAEAFGAKSAARRISYPQPKSVAVAGSTGGSRTVAAQSLFAGGRRNSGTKNARTRLRSVAASASAEDSLTASKRERIALQLKTLLRVGVPATIAGVASTIVFPALTKSLVTITNSDKVFTVLSPGALEFTQQFLGVISLLYSLLVGQTYSFVYSQQEAIFYALYNEVTEAKSLLEQVALVCQGRAMYPQVLRSMSAYVRDDLKQVNADPAVLLSARPADDPLESIMYLTSVGVPGHVYETIRSLRQARAARLGALQRKVPLVHMILLWILAGIMLVTFPLLGAGTQAAGAYNILTVEGCLFGVTAFAVVLTKMLVGELLRPAGGAYNVDAVLSVMVRGLEKELAERLSGRRKNSMAPSTPTGVASDDVTITL